MSSPDNCASNEARITSIDVWRGLAALAVVAIHTPHHAYGGWREHPFFFFALLADYGSLGVPFFVVISGFCIHRRAALKRSKGDPSRPNWLAFWRRRFWRLYPTYLAAILFSLALTGFHGRFNGWDRIGTDLTLHLLMIHNLTSDFATSLSNGAFWSLGMEEQLYLLYIPLLVLFNWSSRRAVIIVLLLTLCWRVMCGFGVLPTDTRLGSWMMWPFAFWLHWTLGAIAVDAWAGNLQLPQWTSRVGVALGLAGAGFILHDNLFAFLDQTRLSGQMWLKALIANGGQIRIISDLLFAVTFFCLLNWGLRRERVGAFRGRIARGLAGIGRISYSLYLVHVPIIYTLNRWLHFGMSPTDWLMKYIVYYSVCLLVAAGFYHLVERHFIVGSAPAVSPAAA